MVIWIGLPIRIYLNMTTPEILKALSYFLFLPLTGLYYFIRLRAKMIKEKIKSAPTIELFIIFATYGALLHVVLTPFLWKWSGMSSLGAIYLILVAPIVMGIIAFKHRKTKLISYYHKWTFIAGILYFAIAPITFLSFYILIEYLRINGI